MPEDTNTDGLAFSVDEVSAGLRLDVFLAGQMEDASRSFLKKVVKDRRVRVNKHLVSRPSRIVAENDEIVVDLPPPAPATLTPENIPLEILHEDADVVVLNKPAGLVVHPAPGHATGTLVHALLYHSPSFTAAGGEADRPGIVHRLDRDTSGVMVVAKSRKAFLSLGKQSREHTFDRRYLAIVKGEFQEEAGRIDASLGRSMVDRKRMAVTGVRGRDAVTNFEVIERFGIASLVALQLETGRTHQIRVHLRFAGRQVLGDPVYGISDFTGWKVSKELRAAFDNLTGQALHAERLGFDHPATGKRVLYTSPPPEEFQKTLDLLREHGTG